jgi:hypothetical protein
MKPSSNVLARSIQSETPKKNFYVVCSSAFSYLRTLKAYNMQTNSMERNDHSTSHDEADIQTANREATEAEIQSLKPVVDKLPIAAWIVALVGTAERFSFYAVTAPWR